MDGRCGKDAEKVHGTEGAKTPPSSQGERLEIPRSRALASDRRMAEGAI